MKRKVMVAVGMGLMAAGAYADPSKTGGADFTKITAAVDFGSVTTAVFSVMGLLAGVYLAVKGGKIVLGLLRG